MTDEQKVLDKVTSYNSFIFNELKTTGVSRTDPTIIHPINNYLFTEPEGVPTFTLNEGRDKISDSCKAGTSITCSLHYKKDWNYRLDVTMSCDEVEARDPCFSTFACLCSNDYSRIASTMPAKAESYQGVIVKPIDVEQEAIEL